MKIVVTQADREAAAELWLRDQLNRNGFHDKWMADTAEQIKRSDHDDWFYVQAFARHRIEALEQAAKVCAKAADDLEHTPRPEYDDHADFHHGRQHQAHLDATAIRNLQGEG